MAMGFAKSQSNLPRNRSRFPVEAFISFPVDSFFIENP